VDKLEGAVFQIIDEVKKNGIGDDYISKVKEIRSRELETDLRENRFWLNELVEHYRYGTDPNKIVELEKKAVERVSSDNVKQAAKRYLGKNRIEGVLWPEAGAGAKTKAAKAVTKAAAKAKDKK
jgi:zinc protease